VQNSRATQDLPGTKKNAHALKSRFATEKYARSRERFLMKKNASAFLANKKNARMDPLGTKNNARA
jgi:hypothetical protein